MIGSAYPEIAVALATDGVASALELVKLVPDKNQLLLDASYALDEPIVRAAIEAGADVTTHSDALGAQGAETALHRAVRGHGSGSFEAVARMLVEAGADLEVRNCSGDNPLHAAMYESEDRVIALLRLGSDPHALDDSGQPPIVKASLLNMFSLVDVLLELGAKVDERDCLGQTSLLLVTKEGRVTAMKALLERGADPNARDNKGYTPKRFAIESGLPALINVFDPSGALTAEVMETKKPGCALANMTLMLFLVAPVAYELMRLKG